MAYLVVKDDTRVLSRMPHELPVTWLDIDLSRCTDYRYAVTFETFSGAATCAGIYGANVHTIGEFDDESKSTRGRAARGVDRRRDEIGSARDARRSGVGAAVEAAGRGPARGVQSGRAAGPVGRSGGNAGYSPARVSGHAARAAKHLTITELRRSNAASGYEEYENVTRITQGRR